jgi:hypothetical protein
MVCSLPDADTAPTAPLLTDSLGRDGPCNRTARGPDHGCGKLGYNTFRRGRLLTDFQQRRGQRRNNDTKCRSVLSACKIWQRQSRLLAQSCFEAFQCIQMIEGTRAYRGILQRCTPPTLAKRGPLTAK